MPLVLDNTLYTLQFAQGQILKSCGIITRDPDPIPADTKINLDIALFVDGDGNGSEIVSTPMWQCTWPGSDGTVVDMNFLGAQAKYKNLKVQLKRISDQTFYIDHEFIALQDTHDYITSYPYSGANPPPILVESVENDPGNLYATGASNILLKVSLELSEVETIEIRIPVTANRFNNGTLTATLKIGDAEVDSYIIGKDLKVLLNSDNNLISSHFYGGIMRVNDIAGIEPFYTESRLQYATIGNSITDAEKIGSILLSKDKLKNPLSIVSYNDIGSEGGFTVDASYFVSGESYVIIWVYNHKGVWYSGKTPIINELALLSDPIPPLIECLIKINGVNQATCCIAGAKTEFDYECIQTFKGGDFATKLNALGINPNTYHGYLKDCTVLFSIEDDINKPYSIPLTSPLELIKGTPDATANIKFKIPNVLAGKKLTAFVSWILEINGIEDHHIFRISFDINEPKNTDIGFGIDPTLPDYYCSEDENGLVTFVVTDLVGKTLSVKLIESDQVLDLEFNDTTDIIKIQGDTFTVDIGALKDNVEYCVLMRVLSNSVTIETSCPCDSIFFSATLLTKTPPSNKWKFELTGTSYANIKYIEITSLNKGTTYKFDDFSNAANLVFDTLSNDAFSFKVAFKNGCIYNSYFPDNVKVGRESNYYYFQIRATSQITNKWALCDFKNNPIPVTPLCTANPAITYTCDGVNAAVPSFVGDGGMTHVSKQYSYQGLIWSNYTVPLANPKVFFRWKLTGANCPDTYVYQYANCSKCVTP